MKWYMLIPVLAASVTLKGCQHVDRYPKSDETQNDLRQLSLVVIALNKHGYSLQDIQSLPEMLAQASRAQYIPRGCYEAKDFQRDGWDNPYRWEVSADSGELVVRVLSCGRNGQFENGQSDDLYIEITFDSERPPKVVSKSDR